MNDKTVEIVINGQQKAFVERVRNRNYPTSTVQDLVRRALAEIGPKLLATADDKEP